MVYALSPPFPFRSQGGLPLYHATLVEKYLPVAPGIEVSVQRIELLQGGECTQEFLFYDRRGHLSSPERKGAMIDTRL